MPRKEKRSGRRLRIVGRVFLFGLGLLLILSLVQYYAQGMGFLYDQAGELPRVGTVSYNLADSMVKGLGVFCAVCPIILILWAWAGARGWRFSRTFRWTFFVGGLAIVAAGLAHLVVPAPSERLFFLGGAGGGYVAARLAFLFGTWGAVVVLGTLGAMLLIGTTGMTGMTFFRLVGRLFRGAGTLSYEGAQAAGRGIGQALEKRERGAATEADVSTSAAAGAGAGTRGMVGGKEDATRSRSRGASDEGDDEEGAEKTAVPIEGRGGDGLLGAPRIVAAAEAMSDARRSRGESSLAFAPREGGGSYTLPPLELLEQGETHRSVPKDELLARSELLEGRLKEFGAEARVVEVHPGPVITRFELEPARGVKVSQIANLSDDLALGLRAQSLRILAPIPGKGTVGIEMPNEQPAVVRLAEVLGKEAFHGSSAKLAMALGKDVSGQPRVTALERMPHLLIAGSTGSGKSVCINAILLSLLYSSTPDEVRFIMIDPKRLELNLYNGIPHLLHPVVIEPKAAVRVLRWAVSQMEWRYRLLAQAGVRDIAGYNKRGAGGARGSTGGGAGIGGAREGTVGEDPTLPRTLPYMVIVVDELADLMLTLPSDMEDVLAKLAQMARAVGIHLILATQRPSVDVLTGVIKANFPSRIAFKVPSKTDSRTILDANGAESLLGRGDMLFLEGGKPEPERIHGCFVSAAEVERVSAFWRDQGSGIAPEVSFAHHEEVSGEDATDDELFREAARLVITHQQGSASLLQRRLKVGYSRASRLIDMLEAAGVVGPFEGSKAREVLVGPSYLEKLR